MKHDGQYETYLEPSPNKVIIEVKMLHTCVETWILAEESVTKVITINGWSVLNGETGLFEKIDNPNFFSSNIAMVLYSTSMEERAIVRCFLDDQLIGEKPSKTTYAPIDHQSSRYPPQ